MVLRVLQTGGGEACTNQCGWMRETEWCGWVCKAKQSSGLAERSGLAGRSGGLAEWERQRSFVERQSFWVRKAKWSSGLAERRLGGAERRLGGAGEAVELCGAAELLGVPLTNPLFPARPHCLEHEPTVSNLTPLLGTLTCCFQLDPAAWNTNPPFPTRPHFLEHEPAISSLTALL